MLHQALGLLDDHLGHLHVALRGLIEGRGDDLAEHRTLHIGHLFGALVDEQHDEVNLGVVGHDRVGDVLHQHGLTSARRRYDQSALTFADGAKQIDDTRRIILGVIFKLELLGRIERGQVVEQNLRLRDFRFFEVDRLNLEQREITLVILGRTNLPADRIAGAQTKTTDLRGRHVNVIRPGQVIVVGGAEEAEAVGEDFENAFAENRLVLLGLLVEDGENQLLLAQAGRVFDTHIARHRGEIGDFELLQFFEVHSMPQPLPASRGVLLNTGPQHHEAPLGSQETAGWSLETRNGL